MQTNTADDPIVMYLIVRESLGMSIGKTAAQCGHACQLMSEEMYKYAHYMVSLDTKMKDFGKPPGEGLRLRSIFQKLEEIVNTYGLWLQHHGYRKVVLSASEKEWEKVKLAFPQPADNQLEKGHILVVDNGLTELSPNTETVIALFPMLKSTAPKIIKRLQLLK